MTATNLSAIFLLLITIAAKAHSCPLSSGGTTDCQDHECEAYWYAKDARTPMYLSINATLSELTNELDTFRNSLHNTGLYPSEESKDSPHVSCTAERRDDLTYEGCTQYFGIESYVNVDDEYFSGARDLACPWTFQCDYNQNRIPQYLWRAECNATTAIAVNYRVPVLKRESCNSLSPWKLVMEEVPVACTCKKL